MKQKHKVVKTLRLNRHQHRKKLEEKNPNISFGQFESFQYARFGSLEIIVVGVGDECNANRAKESELHRCWALADT